MKNTDRLYVPRKDIDRPLRVPKKKPHCLFNIVDVTPSPVRYFMVGG